MTDVLDTRHRLLYTTKGDHNEMVDKCVACQSVVHGTYPLVSVKSHKQQNQKHREVYAILPNSLLRETAGCDHCRKLIWPPELLDMASAPSNIAHGSEHFMLSESGKYVVKCRPDQAKYKSLLCIDGGGIRGILPAMVLKELEDQIKEVIMEKNLGPAGIPMENIEIDLADYFDIISGTSIGSILALYFATKGANSKAVLDKIGLPHLRSGSAEGIAKIIRHKADEIFSSPWYEKIPFLGGLVGGTMFLSRPKYSSDGLISLLQEVFQNMTLKEAHTNVIVPAFELTKKQAFSFIGGRGESGHAAVNNHMGSAKRSDLKPRTAYKVVRSRDDIPRRLEHIPDVDIDEGNDYNIWEVALASSSAPTYFPAAEFQPVTGDTEMRLFVDGGLVANNPSVQAITFALRKDPSIAIENIAVLSLGTGTATPNTDDLKKAGAAKWLTSGALLNIAMSGTSECIQSIVDEIFYGIKKLHIGQYVRINKLVETGNADEKILSEMDNSQHVERLMEIGQGLGMINKSVLKTFVENFIFATK